MRALALDTRPARAASRWSTMIALSMSGAATARARTPNGCPPRFLALAARARLALA